MKYSELIQFKPIESTIQLLEAGDERKARDLVETYVMSDSMADQLKTRLIDQLQMDEVVDNKGVLVVGNYGTGKSHLMSVVSAVANDAGNLAYLQNKRFAEAAKPIAGKFEVLRIEIGGVTMPLRDIICGYIQDDFTSRGIDFAMPDFSQVRDNKQLIRDIMRAFAAKYGDKGYLIVVDEFFSYLSSRDERQIVLDLEFLRALGEMCSKSRMRVIFGVQEKIFDNPRFSFVSETLKRVGDRFTQVLITKEDTSYVVSERILRKTPEQKALIREHLEKFSSLYGGMASRMDEFVDLFPIHPAYVDVLNRTYLIENRHILKNVSVCIKGIFDKDVPDDAPGIISFDEYWPVIKADGMLRSDRTVSRVLQASGQLEDIINRAYPKPAFKPLALQIVYALSVYRLTTGGLDVQTGLTAEGLKDDLCLYLPMPERDADFLLGVVNQVLRDIMTTVSGQFIVHNEANNQYYIDVNKVVDYGERIKQKAAVVAQGDLNRYFYQIVYGCLDWSEKQYVTNFEIYQYDLMWDSHNMFREGYLFLGLPDERSTAQPERDFYLHFMPPFDGGGKAHDLEDEVYFYFKPNDGFTEDLRFYAAAQSLEEISEGKERDAYAQKSQQMRNKLVRTLSAGKSTLFDVSYLGVRKQMLEVLKGRYDRDATFKDTIDTAASLCLDGYFGKKYPRFPVMRAKITRQNMADGLRDAYDQVAGRNTKLGREMLRSFGLLDAEGKVKAEDSPYAKYYMGLLSKLPPQGVINFDDLFDEVPGRGTFDKHFGYSSAFAVIVLLALVYAGRAVIKIDKGQITASNLDQVPKLGKVELMQFRHISKPSDLPLAELRHLFDVLGLNPNLLNNEGTREKAAEDLVAVAKRISQDAAVSERRLSNDFSLWGEPLVNAQELKTLKDACDFVKGEFSNYGARYNTPAKLNNFRHSDTEIDELARQVRLAAIVDEYGRFQSECSQTVGYLQEIEYQEIGEALKKEVSEAKETFRRERDKIYDGEENGDAAGQAVNASLSQVKDHYVDLYYDEHRKKRLGAKDSQRRQRLLDSQTMANLRKLSNLDFLPRASFNAIDHALARLVPCAELTPTELQTSTTCPHCHYRLGENVPNVTGELDRIEEQMNQLVTTWTETLLNTIDDPLVLEQEQYLTPAQQQLIDGFVASRALPERVDDAFVDAIEDLQQGFEPVYVDGRELVAVLAKLGASTADDFKRQFNSYIGGLVKGKDPESLRIIVRSE
jgi:hypothetical protein